MESMGFAGASVHASYIAVNKIRLALLMFHGISGKTNFASDRILTAVANVTKRDLKICAPMQAYEESFAAILHVCVEQIPHGTMCHDLFDMGLVVRTIRLALQS